VQKDSEKRRGPKKIVKIEARSPERRLRLLSPRGFGGREGRKKLPQSRDEVTKNAGPDEVLDVQETLIYLGISV